MLNDDSVYYDMLISLRQIIRCTDLHSKKLVKHYGLTGPQLIIIKVIADEGEISVGKLAKIISLSQATVTNIVERLEQKEILSRMKTDNDKRRVMVRVTEKAHEIISKEPSLLDETFIGRYEKLQTWEQNMLLSSIQRIADMMTGQNENPDKVFLESPAGV